MKIRILNYQAPAAHDSLTKLEAFWDVRSFSDFDALICDPAQFVENAKRLDSTATLVRAAADDDSSIFRNALGHHAQEFADLISVKGGVGVFLLRPNNFKLQLKYWSGGSRTFESVTPYFLLDEIKSSATRTAVQSLEPGSGVNIRVENAAANLPYFRILKGQLTFHAGMSLDLAKSGIVPLAFDSVGRIVAAMISVGKGHLLFLPVPLDGVDQKRFGSALVETIRSLLSPSSNAEEAPSWVSNYPVPGANKYSDEISELESAQNELMNQIEKLREEQQQVMRHQELLYGTGKQVLEPAVREGFRVLGFTVAEPDTYTGEWDLDMTSPSGARLIGEVEGPEGAVDIDKFRQLLQYHNDVMLDGQENRGILVGNAHRLKQPSERGEAFTEHALRSANKTGIALIATTELFKAVCRVLSGCDQTEVATIRESIVDCVGQWKMPEANS